MYDIFRYVDHGVFGFLRKVAKLVANLKKSPGMNLRAYARYDCAIFIALPF